MKIPDHIVDEVRQRSLTSNPRMATFAHQERHPNLDEITIMPTQLNGPRARDFHTEVIATDLVIGEGRCSKPLSLDFPIMFGGMSIWDLTQNARMALIKASSGLFIPFNAGAGGLRVPERNAIKEMDAPIIHQWTPARLGMDADALRESSAVEIQLGRGMVTSLGSPIYKGSMDLELTEHLGLPPAVDGYRPPRHLDIESPKDLKKVITLIREITSYDIPIIVKIGTANVYGDIRYCVKAGADAVVLDTSEAGGYKYPQAIGNGIGLTSLAAITPAVQAFTDTNAKGDNVKLIISGGVITGVDAFKLLALGADGVAIGRGLCLALNSDEVEDGIPQGVFYGTDDKTLDVDFSAQNVINYVRSMATELAHVTAMTGNSSLETVTKDCLRAVTYNAAAVTGLKLAGYERNLLMWEH